MPDRRRQVVVKLAHREPDPTLRGAKRDALALGDLNVCQSFHEGELERPPLIAPKAPDRFVQPIPPNAEPDLIVDVSLGGLQFEVHVRGASIDHRCAPQGIDGVVAGDGHQPWSECPAVRIEPTRIAPDSHQGILDDLLGEAFIVGDAERYGTHRASESRVECFHSALIAGDQSRDQCRVFQDVPFTQSMARHYATTGHRLARRMVDPPLSFLPGGSLWRCGVI